MVYHPFHPCYHMHCYLVDCYHTYSHQLSLQEIYRMYWRLYMMYNRLKKQAMLHIFIKNSIILDFKIENSTNWLHVYIQDTVTFLLIGGFDDISCRKCGKSWDNSLWLTCPGESPFLCGVLVAGWKNKEFFGAFFTLPCWVCVTLTLDISEKYIF